MIFMLCGSCQMDMYVTDVQFISLGDDSFRHRFHVQCENMHGTVIEGEQFIIVNTEGPEKRVIQYLNEQGEKRYGENPSN